MFEKWGFQKKNITKTEWSYIAFQLVQRQAQGKNGTTVTVRGVEVPMKKIQKQRKLYEPDTLRKHQLRMFQYGFLHDYPPNVM